MRRRAFSALLLVVGAALILMIWAASQQFVTSTALRQVTIAEAGRRCLIAASTAVEEGVELLAVEANEPPPEEEDGARAETVGAQLRGLQPGGEVEFTYRPRAEAIPTEGAPIRYSEIRVRAYVSELIEERGRPPRTFNCDKYRKWLVKWNSVPG